MGRSPLQDRQERHPGWARLAGPQCEHWRIGAGGPMAFLEDHVVVEKQATISNSWVGPDTFVGTLLELKDSLAWGALLVNWKTGSHTIIPDPFLMTSLAQKPREDKPEGKLSKLSHRAFVRPFEAVVSLAQKLQG